MRPQKIGIVMMSVLLMVCSFPWTGSAEDNNGGEHPDVEMEAGAYSAKDEAIYGKLNASGTLQDMYVVNIFHVTEPGEIVDHGEYTNVRNLSNLNDMEQTDDHTVLFQAEEGEFYYQGDIKNQPLPWDITITYVLDGQEAAPDELAGKSGPLEIQLATSANEDVDPLFFENYMLQISLTLDPSIFADIQAPDGTEANVGKDKQITFTGMPNQEEEFIVSANVTEFEMDPIDISAIPFSMSIDDPDLSDMTGEMETLADAIRDINQGVGELNSGISGLHSGAVDLSTGSNDYLKGINELNQSSVDLIHGSREIRDVLQYVADAVQEGSESSESPDLSELEALPEGLRELADGLRETAAGLDTLRDNYNLAYGRLDDAINGIPEYNISQEQLESLYESGVDQEVIQEVVDPLVETYESAQNAKGTYAAVGEAFGAVTGTLDPVSGAIRAMADHTDIMATEVEQGMEEMDQLDAFAELQEGLSSLASEYASFHSGLVDYTAGVSDLAAAYEELDAGIHELAEGSSSLDSGANELQDGTEELQESTSDLPDEMQSEVDKMMEEYEPSDFDPKSFVSAENEKVGVVQFVLQTEPIEVEEPETTEEVEVEEEKGFWERFMDLFR